MLSLGIALLIFSVVIGRVQITRDTPTSSLPAPASRFPCIRYCVSSVSSRLWHGVGCEVRVASNWMECSMNVMKKSGEQAIHWGIIGRGNVAELEKQRAGLMRRLAPRWWRSCAATPDKARDFTLRHNVPRWYTDVDALLADPEVECGLRRVAARSAPGACDARGPGGQGDPLRETGRGEYSGGPGDRGCVPRRLGVAIRCLLPPLLAGRPGDAASAGGWRHRGSRTAGPACGLLSA